MKITVYLNEIFRGRNNVFSHIGLFSICGIIALSLVSVIVTKFSFLFGAYFGYIFLDNAKLILFNVISIMLILFLIAYGYIYTSNILNNNDKSLPEFKLRAYPLLMKLLPVFIIWTVYIMSAVFLSFIILNAKNLLFYIYNLLVLFTIPFVNIILIKFSENFKYKKVFFNPALLFKNINMYSAKVLNYILEIVCFSMLSLAIVILILKMSDAIKIMYIRNAVRLFSMCVWAYLSNLTYLLYLRGLTGIIIDKD